MQADPIPLGIGHQCDESILPDSKLRFENHASSRSDAELDLLMFKSGRRFGVECKRADAPRLTPAMHIAMRDLKLDSRTVLYPGNKSYALAENIHVQPLATMAG